jgi:hypothetical protein
MFMNIGSAQAAVICTGCEYIGTVGTYIGSYNPTTGDTSTYQNGGIPNGTVVDDRWVFDVAPGGQGSLSADFTAATAIAGFSGGLYRAGATTCGAGTYSGCTVAALGTLVQADQDADVDRVATGVLALTAGRYIFQLTGTAAGPTGVGAYGGQLGVFSVVPEPATLSMLGLGLFVVARRFRKA